MHWKAKTLYWCVSGGELGLEALSLSVIHTVIEARPVGEASRLSAAGLYWYMYSGLYSVLIHVQLTPERRAVREPGTALSLSLSAVLTYAHWLWSLGVCLHCMVCEGGESPSPNAYTPIF